MKTEKPLVIWVDGGSRGNPGEAGCGIVLTWPDGRCEQHSLYIGQATNNVAEYAALVAALERATPLRPDSVEVRSDSELMVRQLSGAYRVKAPHLRPLWQRARELSGSLPKFVVRHVPREENGEADRLANLAIDTRRSTLPRPTVIP